MKLSNKSNLYFLITITIVFLISGVIIFFLFQYIIKNDVDKTLLEQKEWIIQNIKDIKNFNDLGLSEEVVFDIKKFTYSLPSARNVSVYSLKISNNSNIGIFAKNNIYDI